MLSRMGCRRGTKVSKSWMQHSKMRFLLVCFLFVSCDAALLEFTGSTICLDSGLQIKKPKDVHQSVWQTLRVVDSSGLEVDDCHIAPDGSLLTIPEICLSHETGRRVAHVTFNENMVYQVSCNNEQADVGLEYMPTIDCNLQYMMATIPRHLSGFHDEGVTSTPPPISAWSIKIPGRPQRVNVEMARSLGYNLTSDEDNLMIRATFDASGIQKYTSQGQVFYIGDLQLIQERSNPRITVDVKMICATGPPACNATHMTLAIPSAAGSLEEIYIGDKAVQLTTSSLQQQGMTLDTRNGVLLSISLDKLQAVKFPREALYSLPRLALVFTLDGIVVPMRISPECLVTTSPYNPKWVSCTIDGFMNIQVFANVTKPNLDMSTVTVRNRTCQPTEKSSSIISFRFPLKSCGTTVKYLGGKIFYENEVSALWKDLPPRSISRDSELRETIWCYFNSSDVKTINMSVSTFPPPAPTRMSGPILFVMKIYPDISYQIPYSEYPIVKTLREPIFLEVQVLNRKDPNIELILDDCWATMSEDPNALPQWNVVVDGCQESQDNYLTIFHPVTNVPQATHRKRFEVKAFAFMQDGELTTNLVFFHCNAIICNIKSPDNPLCTKKCPQSRAKRDELFLQRHSNLASLPGPVLLLDPEPSLSFEDERNVIQEVTIGVLPAFALVAVLVLIATFITFKQKAKF
ncbi:zona pellucida sperm-binding protein 2 [Hyla sarda]|uniref:zona pellucida sperm-binding protein 2 n=1 Tax=Hyla sarda TaxID=327740 RepID=UPI0024C24395|nr:zona pellucida sperm-binding protein 2 [Hyla sarda]